MQAVRNVYVLYRMPNLYPRSAVGPLEGDYEEVHHMKKVFFAAVGVALLIGGSVAFAKTASVDITKT